MSQQTFDTRDPEGEPVRVLAGWDVQLQHYFLVVMELDETGGTDIGTIFSNLGRDDPEMEVWEITATLAGLGLPYPEKWIHALVQDKWHDATNRRESHGHFPNPSSDSFSQNSRSHA